jgi:hypothetical protein
MYFNPLRIRAMSRGLKAYTRLDKVAVHFLPDPVPVRSRGKFRKDDSSAKSVNDYLHEKYVYDHRMKRKGLYQPSQIVRNFWRV